MKDNIRIAIIQPKPYPSFDDPRNIGHALQLMEKCRGEELDVICFPEYFPFLGERELGSAARKFNSYLIAGMVEEEGGKRYNTATLFNRAGRVVGRQRKFNVGALETREAWNLFGRWSVPGLYNRFRKDRHSGLHRFLGTAGSGRQLADQGVDIVFNSPALSGPARSLENRLPGAGLR